MKSSKDKQNITLYIHSKSPLSRSALINIKEIAKHASFKSKYQLDIIEIDKTPDIAEQKNILATPLLIYNSNGCETRILGNLSDLDCVYEALGIEDAHDES